MEHGFFHPDHGYWQAIGGDAEELLEGYQAGTIKVPLKPGAYYEWQGGEWVHVPPPDPTLEEVRAAMPPLSARQLRLGLIANGITLASVQAAIDGIADPTAREIAQVEWEYATTFERTHSLILQIGTALNLTPEEIDVMWSASISL